VIGNVGKELYERFGNAPTCEAQISLIDQFFLTQMKKRSPSFLQEQFIISRMYASKGSDSIKDIAHQVNISQRHLRRIFLDTLAFPQKCFQDLLDLM
jgi:transcriptional regulator GlxA family with amidase domain